MAAPDRRTVLRDVFGGPGSCRVAALRDYQGQAPAEAPLDRFRGRVVKANNGMFAAVADVPRQLRDNWRLLRDPAQIRLLVRSLIDQKLMTPPRQKAAVSILLWSGFMLWTLVGLGLAIFNREALGVYQSVVSLFALGVATSMFLPWPFETLLGNTVQNIGVVWTVLVAATAKTFGSWMVLIMGDRANAALQQLVAKNRLLRGILHGLMAFAQKYGYFAVLIIFSIPLMSDTAPLFTFAVLGMKKRLFLPIMFTAISIRSLIFLAVFT